MQRKGDKVYLARIVQQGEEITSVLFATKEAPQSLVSTIDTLKLGACFAVDVRQKVQAQHISSDFMAIYLKSAIEQIITKCDSLDVVSDQLIAEAEVWQNRLINLYENFQNEVLLLNCLYPSKCPLEHPMAEQLKDLIDLLEESVAHLMEDMDKGTELTDYYERIAANLEDQPMRVQDLFPEQDRDYPPVQYNQNYTKPTNTPLPVPDLTILKYQPAWVYQDKLEAYKPFAS